MKSVYQIARKELAAFFASPVAYIFLGTFLLVNLFTFFWVERYFARNIADVRPLFEWMPLLMIFLVAALTMRMWSDERRMGTLEFLLTLPVSSLHLVLGKFFACLLLVCIALLLTLFVPGTMSLLGDLDWGPVLGAYVAALFLGAAYTSIGLFLSSRSDSQIVSLIGTVVACFVLYLLGSDAITPLFGNTASEFFQLLGTGSRFESITRGVIDIRDLYYYLSIVGIFTCLNIYALEKLRWSVETKKTGHTHWRVLTLLFVCNFVAGNLWLHRINSVRMDVTEGNIFSISDATRGYLEQLQEPLLVRGYFSSKTHPLLAPLVPRLRDLILEYEIAGNGKVRSEFIDPRENPELEEEANRKYGIKPVPFQVADKYQASLVNSYFDVLIQYGDKYEVLSFQDLIEVKVSGETDVDVQLRNPEYDITRAIKKVLYGFQSVDHLFQSMEKPITFRAYISALAKLPPFLQDFQVTLDSLLDELKETSDGKLNVVIEDPETGDGALAQRIGEEFGFRPMRAGLFDPETFFFYMTLEGGDQIVQIPLPEDRAEESLRRAVEAGLKRFSAGFLKTVAVYTPPAPPPNPYMAQMGMPLQGKQFQFLQTKLRENYTVKNVDLQNGEVPEDADLLVVVAPDKLSTAQVFAIDQFLMKGGTLVLATGSHSINRTRDSMSATEHDSGLKDWLTHHGIRLHSSMILDPLNQSYPVPKPRRIGGLTVEEIVMVTYPYFVDVRGEGLNQENAMLSGLQQVGLNWSSPIVLDEAKNGERKTIDLLRSSPQSWTSSSTNILPNLAVYPEYGFAPGSKREPHLLGAVVEGKFDSFFAGKESPLLEKAQKEQEEKEKQAEEQSEATASSESGEEEQESQLITSVIDKSSDSARIILFSSNEFLTDQVFMTTRAAGGSTYLNSLQLIENALDWSVEDRGLLTIRSRGNFSRTLYPLERSEQMFWEYLNYALALIGLLFVYVVYRFNCSRAEQHYKQVLQSVEA